MLRLIVRSMRAKSVLAGLVPFLLVLAAVGFIGLRAYDRVARDVVAQRDAELARVTGVRFSERLEQEARILQNLAEDERVRSLEGDGLRSALDEAAAGLGPFNGGIVVYSWTGVIVGASPASADRAGTGSGDEAARLLTAVRTSLRPAFSDVFRDPLTGGEVILIGVPIRGLDAEFGGMLTGESIDGMAAVPSWSGGYDNRSLRIAPVVCAHTALVAERPMGWRDGVFSRRFSVRAAPLRLTRRDRSVLRSRSTRPRAGAWRKLARLPSARRHRRRGHWKPIGSKQRRQQRRPTSQ